ncbi:type III-B CRISPR module RAMP protein Cmr1 [bacterium]|nr:type III-B CRISPR module RAMP protein Cmr1 [bacterium]MBU1957915.1 type III-B CRISPR module RAMP protein Cmr1 [bacterium]
MRKQEEITIEFETITPIWTGDAWSENSELKATAIMGSLRFAFRECYKDDTAKLSKLDNVNNVPNEILDYEKFKKSIGKKNIKEILDEQEISLESQLFGCTRWKSRIVIHSIEADKDKFTLKSVSFLIDNDFLEEFNQFKIWLEKQEIHIGKGQKKQKGGKFKIKIKQSNLKKTEDDTKRIQAQLAINKEIDEKNKQDDIKKNRQTNKQGIRKL